LNSKEKYKAFCKSINYLPIFYDPAWWNLLSPHWEVLHYNYADLDYFIPYIIEKKMGFSLLRNPHLTPYSGIIYDLEVDVNEVDLVAACALGISLLPKASELALDCFPLTFPSAAFSEQKITHLLDITDKESLYGNFKQSLKRQIKKAERQLSIDTSTDMSTLFSLNEASLKRQQSAQQFDTKLAQKLFDHSIAKNSGQLYYSKDEQGNIHAGLWVVYDRKKMYYLMGGSNPDFLGSGAMGLLLWTAIQSCITLGLAQFDFEGSSVQGIARFFKTFGPTEVKYPVITKPTNKLLNVLQRIKKA